MEENNNSVTLLYFYLLVYRAGVGYCSQKVKKERKSWTENIFLYVLFKSFYRFPFFFIVIDWHFYCVTFKLDGYLAASNCWALLIVVLTTPFFILYLFTLFFFMQKPINANHSFYYHLPTKFRLYIMFISKERSK